MLRNLLHALIYAAVALVLSPTTPTRAQPFGKTVVVAYGSGELGPALEAAQQVERELASRRASLISMHDARDRFLTRSRSPQSPSGSDLEALAREAHDAVEHVALGRTAAAQRGVRDIIALAERSLESLNRETKSARQLLDACLALVRASLHAGKRDVAIEQAMGCRRLVPDLSPSESAHPATVVGVLAEADDQLRRMRVGTLHVRERSQRVCSVYLNGRHLGTTPFTLDQASVGEYRAQVECAPEKAGRVHVVHLGDAPVELMVDPFFDESVLTEPRMSLRYASAEAVDRHIVDHAQLVAVEVRADDVVLVQVAESSATLLRVQARHHRLISAIALPREPAGGRLFGSKQLSEALDALSQGRFIGRTLEDFRPPAQLASDDTLPSASEVPAASSASPVLQRSELPTPTRPQAKPLYKRWWLWTAVGIVVAAGVTTGVLLATREQEDRPGVPVVSSDLATDLRITW